MPTVASPKDPNETNFLGKTIPFPRSDHSVADRKVLLFVRLGCHACEENVNLYKSLAARKSRKYELVAIGNDVPSTRRFLAQSAIEPDRVLGGMVQKYGVLATPTVMLVDRNNKVQNVWVGTLTGDRLTNFLGAID